MAASWDEFQFSETELAKNDVWMTMLMIIKGWVEFVLFN